MSTASVELWAAFAFVWAITFLPAWALLSKLVALSASKKYDWYDIRYWGLFAVYRLIIFAPYLVLLIAGRDIPPTLRDVISGWVVLGLTLSAIRFFGAGRTITSLWWLYGLVYDGLLHFYPYNHLLERVTHYVDAKPRERILELGCGTGNVLMCLSSSTNNVSLTGVDSSHTMLLRARTKLRQLVRAKTLQLVQADLMTYIMSCPDQSFDQIVLVNVVYAVPDRKSLWRECLRVIRPNGSIIATTSDRSGSKAIIQEHRANASTIQLFRPALMLVGAIDYFISELSKTGAFAFVSQEQLFSEIVEAGGEPTYLERAYGGAEDGVNILFRIQSRRNKVQT